MDKWGWTSYNRTGWIDDNGKKLYRGYFMLGLPVVGQEYEITTIHFWAKQPILALRWICASGKHPNAFEDSEVN